MSYGIFIPAPIIRSTPCKGVHGEEGRGDHGGQVTSAVVLLHRKMTMERAEPISTM